jgi:probable F420-dependent oxidoreductase
VHGPSRLAVALSHIDGLSRPGQADLLSLAVAAERAGADQVVLSEHVALPAVVLGHPGARPEDAQTPFPFPSEEEYPDPLVALAAIGAVTQRVRLSTNILIAPLRPPVLLAKMAATLDVLCGGRLDLGVGAGWLEEEFDALGVPLQRVAGRMEDTIRACQSLWHGGPASFASATVSFTNMVCSPAPLQPGGPPVWFGGSASEATARRVATIGHGWSIIGSTTFEDIALGVTLIQRACADIGRDPDDIAIRCSLPPVNGADGRVDVERTAAGAARLREVGADVFQLPPLTTFVARPDEVEPALRAAKSALG